MQFWSALDIVNQVSSELGLGRVTTMFDAESQQATQSSQLLAALNAGGNELVLYYPWEQFRKEFAFTLEAGKSSYPLPADWSYFIDQTQWDRTNHWPMLGPKSAAEWAWLKGGLTASFPRMRYRVMGHALEIYPTPASDSQFNLAMEYVSDSWVKTGTEIDPKPNASMVTKDADIVWFHPWIMIKFAKLKWTQLKNFDTTAAGSDFQRVWDSLRGKDVGAPVLSLAPMHSPVFIGAHSIPDGNWNV